MMICVPIRQDANLCSMTGEEIRFLETLLACYNQDPDLKDFRRFLNKAKKGRGLLQSWWSKAKLRECEKACKGNRCMDGD
jgi:hypothetical protein